MTARSFPLRYRSNRGAAWMASLLFLTIGLGGMLLGTFGDHDDAAILVGAIVAALSGAWVLYLLLRRAPTLVLHADALEWRGRRVPYSAVTVGPLQSSTYDDQDAHAFELQFAPGAGERLPHATIHSEQFPRWQEIREVLTERVEAARR